MNTPPEPVEPGQIWADNDKRSSDDRRRRVAARLQWACSHMPMTIASDDGKAMVLAELIIREVLGEPGASGYPPRGSTNPAPAAPGGPQ